MDAAAGELGVDATVEYVYGNQFFGDPDITAYADNWYQNLGVQAVFACGGGIDVVGDGDFAVEHILHQGLVVVLREAVAPLGGVHGQQDIVGARVVAGNQAQGDISFIALDVSEGDVGGTVPENVYCAVYKEELCGYMAGVAAVKLGYTHLGYLGGMAVPAVQRVSTFLPYVPLKTEGGLIGPSLL